MPARSRNTNKKKRIHLTAKTANRHILYEAAVQSVDVELDFLERIYKSKRGARFCALREDFCGTATLACQWVARNQRNRAVGVDLHGPTLNWGRKNHLSRLGKDADRIRLIQADVMSVVEPEVDVTIAFNYSYSVFKKREQLRRYFEVAYRSLKSNGIFVVDSFGGTDATEELEEDRKVEPTVAPDGRTVPSFTYVWEQVRFNPVNHDILCKIHFGFRDGTRLNNAFVYHWRYWTLPELQELMLEAGFRTAEVYVEGWDDEDDEPTGIFRRRTQIEEMAGWVGYVVGQK